MRKILVSVFSFVFVNILFINAFAQYDVKTFGAKGDGKTLDTRAIQTAIDKANMNGGGTVDLSSGTYMIGTLILKDNVELHLQIGAVLLGSPDHRDYKEIIHKFDSRTNGLYAKYFMVFADGARNISITGDGTINGNGLMNFRESDPQNLRPFMVRFVNCENVTIRDVHFLESANWTLHLLGCREVNIDGINITNGSDANRDGLDIDCCQGVIVSNSAFSTGDDAIVMKSSGDIICQDIVITNCVIRTRASAIKTGTESNGGFRNITVSNCIIKDLPMHAGIELMTVDGGIMQNILIENIVMENVATPIFIRVGIRARPIKPGQYVNRINDVKDIFLNNITVTDAKLPSSIMGLHNRKISNIAINNYTVRNSEKQDPVPFNQVPFEEFSYPMAIMFKNLPAYGLYCRNVEDLHLQNVSMYSAENEIRPALAFDRVTNLELFSVKGEVRNQNTPVIHLRNSENVTSGYCRSIGKSDILFEEERNSVGKLNLSNSILQAGQQEIAEVAPLQDELVYEDFKTDLKYLVKGGEIFKGLPAQDLKDNPLKFNLEITKRGSLQLCLLILNDQGKAEKVQVKYDGIVQEFLIDWKTWGWAPVTMLKEYPENRKVDFEIVPLEKNSNLKISGVYIRYQDIHKTD